MFFNQDNMFKSSVFFLNKTVNSYVTVNKLNLKLHHSLLGQWYWKFVKVFKKRLCKALTLIPPYLVEDDLLYG